MKPLKRIQFVLFLLASTGSAFWLSARVRTYREEQWEWQARQWKFLNREFSGVRRQGRQVLLAPWRGSFLLFDDGKRFDTPQILRSGSRFMVPDNHHGVIYTITGIESEGVDIHFDISGYTWARGTVRLNWK